MSDDSSGGEQSGNRGWQLVVHLTERAPLLAQHNSTPAEAPAPGSLLPDGEHLHWGAVQQPLNPYCQVERAKAEEEAAEAEWAAAVAAQEAWEAAEAERRATIAAARAAAGLPPEEAPQVRLLC